MARTPRQTTQHVHLPEAFRRFFWSYRFEELDAARDPKTIIVQLLNYGSLAEWRWLVHEYGLDGVKRVLESIPMTEIKPRTRALASILFSNPTWSHAQRGTY